MSKEVGDEGGGGGGGSGGGGGGPLRPIDSAADLGHTFACVWIACCGAHIDLSDCMAMSMCDEVAAGRVGVHADSHGVFASDICGEIGTPTPEAHSVADYSCRC